MTIEDDLRRQVLEANADRELASSEERAYVVAYLYRMRDSMVTDTMRVLINGLAEAVRTGKHRGERGVVRQRRPS